MVSEVAVDKLLVSLEACVDDSPLTVVDVYAIEEEAEAVSASCDDECGVTLLVRAVVVEPDVDTSSDVR